MVVMLVVDHDNRRRWAGHGNMSPGQLGQGAGDDDEVDGDGDGDGGGGNGGDGGGGSGQWEKVGMAI